MDDFAMSDHSPNDTDLEEDGAGGPKIAASDEMEAALQEAIASSEKREAEAEAASGAEGATSADKMTIEMLSEELQDLKGLHEEKLGEIAEKEDAQLRLQAEFENFRRRSLKEKHIRSRKELITRVTLDRCVVHD